MSTFEVMAVREAGRKVIYLDNAATSWPKPKQVLRAMAYFMNEVGANPGRSGHRLSVEAGRLILSARENVASLFNIEQNYCCLNIIDYYADGKTVVKLLNG